MKNQGISSGVYAACPTPFKPDFSIDESLLIDHCHWLLKQGCHGICLAGSTGEASSLTINERKSLLEMVLEGGIDADCIIVGTGSCSFFDTIELTHHAVSKGAAGVLMLPPYFYKPLSLEGLKNYFTTVIEAVGQQDLRIYLYHIPRLTGIPITSELIQALVQKYSQNIVGIKDSSNSWEHMQEMNQSFAELQVYSGSEKFLTDLLESGGNGCISATVNLTGSIASQVFHHAPVDRPHGQKLLNRFRTAFEEVPLIAGVKYALSQITGSTHWRRLRAPLQPLNRKESEKILALTDQIPVTIQ